MPYAFVTFGVVQFTRSNPSPGSVAGYVGSSTQQQYQLSGPSFRPTNLMRNEVSRIRTGPNRDYPDADSLRDWKASWPVPTDMKFSASDD